jgi:hypothetical protein
MEQCRQHREQSSDSIKGKELFDELSDYSVLKKDFTSYTKLTGKLQAYERPKTFLGLFL